MIRCFIGLGSNLCDPALQLQQALTALAALPQSTLGQISSFYGNAAIGPGAQPDFINAVAELFSTLPAQELLNSLHHIETVQGRIRGERWGARTLDLDLLLYGNDIIDELTLQVPHPRLHERSFVLLPLHEIAPDLILPNGTSLSTLLDCCPSHELRRIQ